MLKAMAQYACATLGLILVNLNPAYRTSEIEHAIKLVGMKGMIITPQLKTSNYIELLNEIIPELKSTKSGEALSSLRFPALKHIISTGSEHYSGIMNLQDILMTKEHPSAASSDELRRILLSVSPDDAHNIQFTSGTTGLPKGATLSHRNVVNNGYFIGQHQRLAESDTICVPVPLFHCFGMVIGNLAAFTHGSRFVYSSAIFDPKAVLEAVQAEKCTALFVFCSTVLCRRRIDLILSR
jgi:fatty-acyl-CoA synthase